MPHGWFWTLVVLGLIGTPSILATLLDLFRKPPEVLLAQHLSATMRAAGRRFGQVLFTLTCLPYEAYFSLDAILRAMYRMLVSHRGLLNGAHHAKWHGSPIWR